MPLPPIPWAAGCIMFSTCLSISVCVARRRHSPTTLPLPSTWYMRKTRPHTWVCRVHLQPSEICQLSRQDHVWQVATAGAWNACLCNGRPCAVVYEDKATSLSESLLLKHVLYVFPATRLLEIPYKYLMFSTCLMPYFSIWVFLRHYFHSAAACEIEGVTFSVKIWCVKFWCAKAWANVPPGQW